MLMELEHSSAKTKLNFQTVFDFNQNIGSFFLLSVFILAKCDRLPNQAHLETHFNESFIIKYTKNQLFESLFVIVMPAKFSGLKASKAVLGEKSSSALACIFSVASCFEASKDGFCEKL